MNRWRSLVLGLAVLGLLTSIGAAQQWPNRPIRAYVGWSAGGSSDIVTRSITREMEDHLGQTITVTNVDGALGSIAGRQVAAAPANGNLWFGGAMVLGTWPTLGQADISWDDFYSFIALVMPTTIYVRNDAPWQTIQELVADIEASQPGSFRYGHPGRGSNGEIFAGALLEEAGVGDRGVQSIPYGGGREAGRFLLSGDVEFVSVTMGDLADWAVAGEIRPLANLFEEEVEFEGVRFPAVTEVYPELAPMQAINPYFGISVRRDTPEEVITRMAEAFAHAVQQERFQQVAVQERAGILAPAMGQASDEIMARIESARGWALYEFEVAPNNPADFGIPRLEEWTWPPHERAEQANPWPEAVEEINAELQ